VVESHTLNDGRRVAIRPIAPDDHERLRASHARLSPESRYRRFLATKPELSSADARYLVEIDGSDHFALVATVPEEPDEPIVAVARYIRLADDPAAAEYAVVVGDDYQRQGLATELMTRLAYAAAARGIKRFRATMLADNVAIHRVSAKLAAGPFKRRVLGSLSEVEIELAVAGDAAAVAPAVGPRPGETECVRSSPRALEADRTRRTQRQAQHLPRRGRRPRRAGGSSPRADPHRP
jgi:RimJ/RimL family protein N-acetyltransferase